VIAIRDERRSGRASSGKMCPLSPALFTVSLEGSLEGSALTTTLRIFFSAK
jgi:hypothetical protein